MRKTVGTLLGLLPPCFILGLGSTIYRPGSSAGENVKGLPKPIFFSIVWLILTVLWSISIIYASFNIENNDGLLITLHVFSIMTLICCILWLAMYKKDKKTISAQIMLLSLLFAMLMLSTCTLTQEVVPTLCITPLCVWLLGATLFNYLEINSK